MATVASVSVEASVAASRPLQLCNRRKKKCGEGDDCYKHYDRRRVRFKRDIGP